MKITTSGRGHGYETGDIVFITMDENRWWVKLWYRATFRKIPMRKISGKVGLVKNMAYSFEVMRKL
jgi:hypothetical protein